MLGVTVALPPLVSWHFVIPAYFRLAEPVNPDYATSSSPQGVPDTRQKVNLRITFSGFFGGFQGGER